MRNLNLKKKKEKTERIKITVKFNEVKNGKHKENE